MAVCYRVNRHVPSLSRFGDAAFVAISPGDIVSPTTKGGFHLLEVIVGAHAGSYIYWMPGPILAGNLLTPLHPLTALASQAEGSSSS